MNGRQHYARAETLLKNLDDDRDRIEKKSTDAERRAYLMALSPTLATAQVHATLALADATHQAHMESGS